MNKKRVRNINEVKRGLAYRRIREIMDARVRLAVEINEVRELKGWTQQELAKRAFTTQKVISKIENGDTNIGFDLLTRVTRCLGVWMQVGRMVFSRNIEDQIIEVPFKKDVSPSLSRKNTGAVLDLTT